MSLSGNSSPPRPTLSRLGAWVAATGPDSLGAETLRAARYELADMVAAAHASGRMPACRAVETAVRATAGAGGRSTVIASGEKLPPIEAAQVNAAYSMAQDFDAIVWMGHTCHSAVFAALAVAEHEGASSAEMLTAIVVANEIGGRLGASCFFGPLNGQMWSFVHLVGAAAATAKLLRLDAERTAHAMAISLAQPNFPLHPGFFHPKSKLLTAATPLGIGIRAAYLAREGVTGALDILEDKRGFWHRFAFRPLPEMLDGLGELWLTETLSVKTYPGCFFFQTTCSAMAELLRRHPRLELEDVTDVLVETTKLGTEVTRAAAQYPGDKLSSISIGFDLALTVAVMLEAGRLTSQEHEEAWLAEHTAGILRWRERIQVTHDPSLTVRMQASSRGIPAARKALSALGVGDLVRLAARYRADNRASLFTAKDVVSSFRAARQHAAAPPPDAEHVRRSPSAIPLYFPGRVTLRFRDGRRDSVQVDLPVGTFAAPHVEREVREKFLRESEPALGAPRAETAFAACLALEATTPGELARLAAKSPPMTKATFQGGECATLTGPCDSSSG